MRRRTFLGSSALALGAAALGGSRAAVAANDRIRIGVIGTGARGQELMRALAALPAFEIAALCDTLPFRLDEGLALAVASKPVAYADHRHLLEDRSLDAVIVATPFHHHATAALDAVAAGKHVYCEKTMIRGVADTRRVLEAVRGSGLVFQAGFQWHTAPLYEAALALIRGGELGEIAAIHCQWNRNGDWRRPVPDPALERQINWRMYREYSGGLAAELTAHQVDFANLVVPGGIEYVSGVGDIDYWKDGRETYDNIRLTVRYRAGVTATFMSLTTNSLGGYRVSILGRKGAIELTTDKGWFYPEVPTEALPDGLDLVSGASAYADTERTARAQASDHYAIDAPPADPTAHALELFGRSIREDLQPASNVETGAVVSVMVQMALDAMDSASVVRASPEYALPPA
ncbi:MAG TPA: Gfo/Idh/MocA family oxidoreductase [Woeseiaceae bacterium]|nr:Gfo/Idh/MocA family oxidoreductase [Woeseiaceae bacterium]